MCPVRKLQIYLFLTGILYIKLMLMEYIYIVYRTYINSAFN